MACGSEDAKTDGTPPRLESNTRRKQDDAGMSGANINSVESDAISDKNSSVGDGTGDTESTRGDGLSGSLSSSLPQQRTLRAAKLASLTARM